MGARVAGIVITGTTLGDLLVTVDDRGLPDLQRRMPTGWVSLKDSRQAAPVAREVLDELGMDFRGYDHTQQLLKALVVLGLNRVTEMFFSAARW